MKLTGEEFEDAIADAIDSIPDRFLDELENVAFIAEDEPTPEQSPQGDLLGLYEGVSLAERGDDYGFSAIAPTRSQSSRVPTSGSPTPKRSSSRKFAERWSTRWGTTSA